MRILRDNHKNDVGSTICLGCGSLLELESTDNLHALVRGEDKPWAAFRCPCCGVINILPPEETEEEAPGEC